MNTFNPMTIPQQKYQRRWHCHGGSRFPMFQKVVKVKSKGVPAHTIKAYREAEL
jgi:hypothetical protein